MPVHPPRVVQGDITRLAVDAIVNAANSSLLGGNGVDGAIHRAAGPDLLNACRRIGHCKTGQSVITPGFALPARHVIHTVGPVWRGGDQGEAVALASCYRTALVLAQEHQLSTVAFPCISTGAYRFPPDDACRIAIDTVLAFLNEQPWRGEVVFCVFSDADRTRYERELAARAG